MGNRYSNYKWLYIKSKGIVKVYPYHSKQEQDNFTRWSYADLDNSSSEVTYKQALRLALDNSSIKIDIARVSADKRASLFSIFEKYNILDAQIIST